MSIEAKQTKIPFPGGSGSVPSGPMQFQEDWPGLFVRGDDAIGLGLDIRHVIEVLKEKKVDDERLWLPLSRLKKMSEVIEQGVRVK